MADAPAQGERHGAGPPTRARRRRPEPAALYAALDLGTNNCRLLIAEKTHSGFRVVDAFSRIVRLGEGLSQSGELQPAAMDRAVAALKVCAERLRRRGRPRVRAVATQACRTAGNGKAFLERVRAEAGLELEIISPKEEARLSVAGCVNLLDRAAKAALVLDVGGGSTELSWLDLGAAEGEGPPPILAWLSIPIGVVTLAERFPEARPGEAAWYRAMVEAMKAPILAFERANGLRAAFAAGEAHLIGTSGAITSLAGIHLDLPRYDRNRVDGLWMTRDDCEATADRLLAMEPAKRATQPCVGPDRADLVLAGAAILQAVQETWPCARVRVADRGLREGLLLSMMAGRGGRRRRRRRGRAAPGGGMSEPPKRRMVRPPGRGGDAGRSLATRIKSNNSRSPSSKAWLERQLNDDFVRAAKAKGYRSRAAYKLAEIDDRFHLIRRGTAVLDLGCAPGGWLQVALERGAGAVAGVDLLPVDPLAGVELLEMDFTDPLAAGRLIAAIGGAPDVILSDMAPNTTGHRATDHLRIIGLIEEAAAFALEALKPGGAFVAKAFQGGETAEVVATLKRHFASVRHVKPKASRAESSEVYIVATGFKGAGRTA